MIDDGKLKIKIPKKFYEDIFARFDISKARVSNNIIEIRKTCILCVTYGRPCNGCPFDKLKTRHLLGCGEFIRRVLYGEKRYLRIAMNSVYWKKEDDLQAKMEIEGLKERAKQYIEWVD